MSHDEKISKRYNNKMMILIKNQILCKYEKIIKHKNEEVNRLLIQLHFFYEKQKTIKI